MSDPRSNPAVNDAALADPVTPSEFGVADAGVAQANSEEQKRRDIAKKYQAICEGAQPKLPLPTVRRSGNAAEASRDEESATLSSDAFKKYENGTYEISYQDKKDDKKEKKFEIIIKDGAMSLANFDKKHAGEQVRQLLRAATTTFGQNTLEMDFPYTKADKLNFKAMEGYMTMAKEEGIEITFNDKFNKKLDKRAKNGGEDAKAVERIRELQKETKKARVDAEAKGGNNRPQSSVTPGESVDTHNQQQSQSSQPRRS